MNVHERMVAWLQYGANSYYSDSHRMSNGKPAFRISQVTGSRKFAVIVGNADVVLINNRLDAMNYVESLLIERDFDDLVGKKKLGTKKRKN